MSSNNHNKDKIESNNRIEIEDDDEEKRSLIKVEPTTSLDLNKRNSNLDDEEIVVEVSKNNLPIPSKNQKALAK